MNLITQETLKKLKKSEVLSAREFHNAQQAITSLSINNTNNQQATLLTINNLNNTAQALEKILSPKASKRTATYCTSSIGGALLSSYLGANPLSGCVLGLFAGWAISGRRTSEEQCNELLQTCIAKAKEINDILIRTQQPSN